MGNRQNWIEWIKNLPNWIKGVVGFVGAIVVFIIAFRQNPYLYLTVIFFLLLAVLFATGLILAFKKTKPLIEGGRGLYQFQRYRPLGFALIATIPLVVLLLSVLKPTRGIMVIAILGTPTPTPLPTATPTPIPTPTPTEVKLPAADVLITEFDARHASRRVEVARRLEADLKDRLRVFGLQDVRVSVIPQAVSNEDEAQSLVNQTGSKVVIWGWYDDLGISVRVFLSGEGKPGKEVPGSREIPLETGDVPLSGLNFVVQDVLPDNTSFLSLFVIGHLYYLADNYLSGHAAFDAAMQSIPQTVALENEALVQFFSARLLDVSGSDDLVSMVCGYARAIELDPSFAEAYNNLGAVLTRAPEMQESPSFYSLPEKAQSCLEPLGLSQPVELFNKALEAQPGWAVAEFNKWATYWWASQWYWWEQPPATPEEIQAGIESVAKRDPSITMAPIVLANMAVLEGDLQAAQKWFTQALERLPGSAQLHHNLGQVYLKLGQYEQAEAEFLATLDLKPGDPETLLALANLAYLRKDLKTARETLERLQIQEAPRATQLDPEFFSVAPYFEYGSRYLAAYVPANMASILQSRLDFEAGETERAIQLLEKVVAQDEWHGQDAAYIVNYLLALLYELNHDQEQSDKLWEGMRYKEDSLIYLRGPVQATNATTVLAWRELGQDCADEPKAWGSVEDPCLPADPQKRIQRAYQAFQGQLSNRMYYVAQHLFSTTAECPYLYVYNVNAQAWIADGTLLYQFRGAENEATQIRPLAGFDGRLLIRELEPERSYIDLLYVVVADREGSLHRLDAGTTELALADGQYLTLERGMDLWITFEGFDQIEGPTSFWVVARGYYLPLADR